MIELSFYFYSYNSYGGADVASGWYIDEVWIETGEDVFNNPEDFESGFDDWYTDFGTWEIGTPSVVGPGGAYEGTQCAGTILTGNYYDNTQSRLISPAFAVPSASENPVLRFWHWYNFNIEDMGQVQVRVVGDTTGWQTLETYSGYVGDTAWTSVSWIELTDVAGQRVQLSFYFYSYNSYGGADVASGWYIDEVIIETDAIQIWCPEGPISRSLCVPGEICISLPIVNADSVDAGAATWANDTLCFTADTAGSYVFPVIAINTGSGDADTCEVTVNVFAKVPLVISPDNLIFVTTNQQYPETVPEQTITISSPCTASIPNWEILIAPGAEWLTLSDSSGTVPASIDVGIADSAYTAGVYDATLIFTDLNTGDTITSANVTLFVEHGTDVANVFTQPGTQVSVPINIYSTQPLSGFTIPLTFHSAQLGLVTLDSIVVNPALPDSFGIEAAQLEDTIVVVYRPKQNPPMPDSSDIEVARMFYSISAEAIDEYIPIDTVTATDSNSVVYTYKFSYAAGDTVPPFNAGSITIGTPNICDCPHQGDLDGDGVIGPIDVIMAINYIFRSGPPPPTDPGCPAINRLDWNCDGIISVLDAVFIVQYVYKFPAYCPCDPCECATYPCFTFPSTDCPPQECGVGMCICPTYRP
jgi:hypothetical protein